MSGSVESAKDGAKVDAAKASATEAKPSADALLKQAVSGAKATKPAAPSAKRKSVLFARNGRYAAVATGALVVGTAFGMMSAPAPHSGDQFSALAASLEASRAEAKRLTGEVEMLSHTVASLRDSGEAARTESRSLGASVFERLSKFEQDADKKFTGLNEAIERSGRDQAARIAGLASQAEKKITAPVPAPTVTPATTTAPVAKSEPAQTGSIAESKPKVETVESWALRDVYDGVAIIEDRKRRLVEVAPGETVPGIGRVEAIEHRGRAWVVVTKQGLITTQTW